MDESEQEKMANAIMEILLEPTTGSQIFTRQFALKNFGLKYKYPSHFAKGYVRKK